MMGMIWLVSLSIFLDRTKQWITRPSVRRWLDEFCGAVLVGLGLRLVPEDRQGPEATLLPGASSFKVRGGCRDPRVLLFGIDSGTLPSYAFA